MHKLLSARPAISRLENRLKPAVKHALAVEGHRTGIHHRSEASIFHHLGVYAVAMRARLEHDIREHHRLAGLGLHLSWEWNSPLYREVVANTFLVIQRAVLAPNLSRLLRDPSVGLQVFLWNRQNIS